MADSDSVPVWKKLYQIISGSNAKVPQETFDNALVVCKKKLERLLLEYKPYRKESFDEWRKTSEKMALFEDDEICHFIHYLSKELDLEVDTAWLIVCNFLIFEYYDKVHALRSIIKYEANVQSFIEHVWYFYSADRMFLLKTLRCIFEKVSDPEFKYYDEFKIFVKCVDKNAIWKNLVQIFENLILEITKEKAALVSATTLNKWVHRNNREQSEVLMLMIHLVPYIDLDGNELSALLKLFIKHGFTRHPVYREFTTISRPKDQFDVMCAEYGLMFTIINRYMQKPGIFKELTKDMEKSLEMYQLQSDNCVAYFIWVVYKFTLSKDNMDYCTDAIHALQKKKIYKCLESVLSNEIFWNCKSGDIVFEGIHNIMREYIGRIGDFKYLYEQEGIIPLMCLLLKRPEEAALDYTGALFEIAIDIFPLILDDLLNMCRAIIESGKQYEKIINILEHMPSFCSDLHWAFLGDMIKIDETRPLFADNKTEFIMQAGTVAEKCVCFGVPYTKFVYPYNFFEVIEQYFRTLLRITRDTQHVNNLLMSYAIDSTKFLTFLAEHSGGKFKHEKLFRKLMMRLDCSPTTYIEGPLRRMDLFTAYFEFKCKLIVEDRFNFHEVFTPVTRKLVLPFISEYSEADQELVLSFTHSKCVLYNFLKEEELTSDHTLLIVYLEFIYKVVKKDILQKEVQFAGMWFMINIVFNLYQGWIFKSPEQETRVVNLCLSTFILILQKSHSELSHENGSYEVFQLCLGAFLDNEATVTSICSFFIKDKFYLQTIMEQESNWMQGPLLENIENIRLSIVLFLFIFKQRAHYKERCYIDSMTTVIAKASSLYLINSYRCNIAIISCKFLEVLARNDNFPLIASLGLDSDQVQTLFLDRLRDPMEDEEVKLNILDLISTCIFHQNGMTAAFFDIQCAKKWYSESHVPNLDIDTVADFIIDYLENIKKSHEYLKCPLQVAVLKVMSNLWVCKKQHLIDRVTSLESFWSLLSAPFFRPFVQSPGVYAFILNIINIHFSTALLKPEENKHFFKAIENLVNDKEQLKLLEKYIKELFETSDLSSVEIKERGLLVKGWAEFLVVFCKQSTVKGFTDEDIKRLFVELCMDGIKLPTFNVDLLDTWLDFSLVVIKNFGLRFSNAQNEIVRKAIDMCGIIQIKYRFLKMKSRKVALCILHKILQDLKPDFETNTNSLNEFLNEIATIVDYEYVLLEDVAWDKLKSGDRYGKEEILPWTLIIIIANSLLSLKNCKDTAIWFSYREYLPKLIKFTTDVLCYKDTAAAGKIALYSLTLYMKSPLASDFGKVNLLTMYDKFESYLTPILLGPKLNVTDLKEGWECCLLLMKFNQEFIKHFQKRGLNICYTFLTLNDSIIRHIMAIPETTVDTRALDLLTETLKFFDEILRYWSVEWCRKSHNTYSFMIMAVKRVINSCIYISLRPKHTVFYYFDTYQKLCDLDTPPSDLMIVIINKLTGALGIAFTCLYKLNIGLLDLLDVYEPDDPPMLLIENDFTVPRFQLPIPYDLTYGKILCLAHFYCKTLNQMSQKKTKSTTKVNEEFDCSIYFGLVEHRDPSDNLPNQKLREYLRYAMYEYSGLMDPWIENLDANEVNKSLELLMMFLGQQTFLTIKYIEPSQLPYFKRNLYSELQFFTEYIKKRIGRIFDGPSSTTSLFSLSSHKVERDLVRRYMDCSWKQDSQTEIVEKNFMIVFYCWFHNICQVR